MLRHDKLKNNFPFVFLLCVLILSGSACEPAPSMMENKAATPLPAAENTEKLTPVQREVRDMETANFTIIYVFKRRDGGVFDKEDKNYLSANKSDANRFILTDDEKAFVAGSNYPFLLEHLEALRKRFVVEDYSKPGAPTPIPSNTSNTNQAANNSNNSNNSKNVKKVLP